MPSLADAVHLRFDRAEEDRLQRNLLYTAVTRARKLVVLVGSKKAIGQAVRTVGAGRRHTTLDYRLSHP